MIEPMTELSCGMEFPCSTEHYTNTMHTLVSTSPAAKIVLCELEQFFERARKKLNELGIGSTTIDRTIQETIAVRFGNPVAKAMTKVCREQNSWNIYQGEHRVQKKEEMTVANTGIFTIRHF
jgi:hypothetical protein